MTSLLRRIGIGLIVFLRLFMGLFYAFAGIRKFFQGYLWSDYLKVEVFTQRLTEIPPDSFGAQFISNFAMPLYIPISYILVFGETAAGIMLLFGVAARFGAGLAMFFIVMFAIGGYYDASLIVLGLIFILLMATPSGHWLGFDRILHRRYPNQIWFR